MSIEFYTVDELAKLLKVSRKSIYRYIKSGKIKAAKIGQWRITKSEVDKLFK